MPRFLSGLFETKAVAPRNAVPRAISNSRSGLYTGVVPNMQSWDIDQAITQAYERVIWVYRCIDAIASNSSSVPMILREYSDVDGVIREDDDLLNLLNRRPNIYETSQQFRYRVATQSLLSRRGVFIEVVRNRAGRPKQLHILPSANTTPIPDANRFVSGYKVQTLTQGEVVLEPEQVVWIRIKPHPTDVYAQMTPLVSAGLAADTDFLARLYNRNFLANDGRPGMLLAVQGQLSVEDAEEIRRRFSGGPTSAGQTTVLEADGITAVDMSANPRDVQWQEAVRGSKEDILLAFGVPESILGNAAGRTFDNADAEFEIFWSVTMQPFMDAMAAGYDILTAGGVEDDLLVAHDYRKVDVLQRQERRRNETALNEYRAGLLTIDEYLKVVGRQEFDVPGSRVLWIPQGSVPIGRNEGDTEAAAALMPVGQAPLPTPEEAARTGAQAGTAVGQLTLRNTQAARALRLAGKQLDPLVEIESKITPGSKPAKPSERITGSDKNPKGSASTRAGKKKVILSASIEKALTAKVSKHNESVADKPAWSRATAGALRSVYRRGAGAFSTSHRPGMGRNQWAMARVNAYLHLLSTGKPKNPKYTTDNDLLPKDHPRKSESKHLPGRHNQQTHGRDKFGLGIDLSWDIPNNQVCTAQTGRQQVEVKDQGLLSESYTYRPQKVENGPPFTIDITDEQLDDFFRREISSASEQDTKDGMKWYYEARAEAQSMSEEYGVTLEVAAGVISALSPRQSWQGNLTNAHKVLTAFKSGIFDDMTDKEMSKSVEAGLSENVLQAVKILRTGNVPEHLTGLKRRSFVNNIINPDAGYDVTVDGWVAASIQKMLGAPEAAALGWLGRERKKNLEIIIGGQGYIRLADSIRRIAKERGITPAQAQAIYWLAAGGGKSEKGGMWA